MSAAGPSPASQISGTGKPVDPIIGSRSWRGMLRDPCTAALSGAMPPPPLLLQTPNVRRQTPVASRQKPYARHQFPNALGAEPRGQKSSACKLSPPLPCHAPWAEADLGLLLAQAEKGEPGATDLLFGTLYRQLHRLPRRKAVRLGPCALRGPSTLLHEAWLDISQRAVLAFPTEGHFMACAAHALRGLLISPLGERQPQQRGGGLASPRCPPPLASARR